MWDAADGRYEEGGVKRDATDGTELSVLWGHLHDVNAVASCTVDGRTLVLSGSWDHTVRMWDVGRAVNVAAAAAAEKATAPKAAADMRDVLVTPRMKEIAAFEQHAAALHAAIGGEAVPTSGDLKTERMTFTSARAYAIKVEAALAQKPAAWATWLEAVLDVKLLQGGSSATARAVCITRMAHVLGADHAVLLLELDQFGLSTRDTLRTHLAAQAAGRVAGNAAAAGAAAGDAGKGTSTECH
jgi:hypothetical protein